MTDRIEPLHLSEAEWKKRLTKEQYHVLREKGTEYAFTGCFVKTKNKGDYVCAGCQLPLFKSDTKFESGTGWPSYWEPISPMHLNLIHDHSHGMQRTEVVCARCGGHLGHIFDDGPPPTNKRYCINSVSLEFVPEKS